MEKPPFTSSSLKKSFLLPSEYCDWGQEESWHGAANIWIARQVTALSWQCQKGWNKRTPTAPPPCPANPSPHQVRGRKRTPGSGHLPCHSHLLSGQPLLSPLFQCSVSSLNLCFPLFLKFPGVELRGNQKGKRHVYPNVHRSTVYNSQDMEAT